MLIIPLKDCYIRETQNEIQKMGMPYHKKNRVLCLLLVLYQILFRVSQMQYRSLNKKASSILIHIFFLLQQNAASIHIWRLLFIKLPSQAQNISSNIYIAAFCWIATVFAFCARTSLFCAPLSSL
jgi:hypothetical protein